MGLFLAFSAVFSSMFLIFRGLPRCQSVQPRRDCDRHGTFRGLFGWGRFWVLSPLLFARIGVDPAVASGPIVTAFNDFLSMSIYFLIAIGLSAFLFS